MKRIGDIIPYHFRNCGASYGLEYPFIFAHDLDRWIIWHRHRGQIFWISEGNSLYDESECAKMCRKFNGLNDQVDQQVLNDMDSEP